MVTLRIIAGVYSLLILAARLDAASPLDQLVVPNSSFEESDDQGRLPRAWEFLGSRDAPASAWTSETPYAGNRALRIDARRGSNRWQSEPVQLPSKGEYLLTWQTRFRGEKDWRFRASFCGVEAELQDQQGRSIQSVQKHSYCWQTVGWQPAWLRVTAPDRAKSIVIRFGIETEVTLPGGFEVDSVELVPWPLVATDAGRAVQTLQIRDENGLPTAARVRAASSSGGLISSLGGIHYRVGGGFHPLEEGVCQLLIPADTYAITVTKGFEYWPSQKSLRVEGKDARIEIALERAWDWGQRGWYCGDHHTHLYRHGGSLCPMLTWRDVMRAARCEGLSFLPFMGADRYPSDIAVPTDETERPGFTSELTDEITEDLWGHVCPIGARPEQLRDPRYDEGPMNFDRDAAIYENGVLCYAHPSGPLSDDDELAAVSDPKRGHVAREFPIDLALGMRCGIDLLTMEGDGNQLQRKLRDVYRLYNLGFRPALTASTDFHVDQARQPIGAVRTYVQSGELRMPSIAAAYRAGRTFATNGPLIDLKVGDAVLGDEVALNDDKQSLPVSVEAVSIGPLERVEIIVNGQPVHTLLANEPHRIVGTFSLPAPQSLWIAAKAIGPADPHLASELEGRSIGAGQFAHTSPVYVLVEGRPILAAQPDDAHYFARWCDAALQAWQSHVLENPAAAKDDQLVRRRVEQAKGVYLELASRTPKSQ